MRLRTLIARTVSALCLFAAGLAAASAQDYPARQVRIVVPYPAGGGIDILARALGAQLAQRWGQPFVVENRPGSGTIAGATAVARAEPDGYTLMLTTDATMSVNPHIYRDLPYAPAKDFAPITQLINLNQLLLANPGLPANTLPELLAYAKANPGKLNYASYGSGSQPHLAMEMLKSQAGVDIVHVPYKGIPQAIPAAIGGEVQLTFSGAASSRAHLQSGKLKAIAIGGQKRLALVPDVPTFAEHGFPDVPANAWFGLFAPAGTPQAVIGRLQGEIDRILKTPDFSAREIDQKGYELVSSTPEAFAAFLVRDAARSAKAVQVSGAKAE